MWWKLYVFDIGATITFSRPIGWPHEGIEVALPLNAHDRVSCRSLSFYSCDITFIQNLTAAVSSYPPEVEDFTTYSAQSHTRPESWYAL
jgi:hypothetical protein